MFKTADELYAEFKKNHIREKMFSALAMVRFEIQADPESEFRIATNRAGYDDRNANNA